MQKVEINTTTQTKQQITLDGNVYFFELKWTGLFWNFMMLYSDNKTVLCNTRVVQNFSLLTFYKRHMMSKINKQLVRFEGDVIVTLDDYNRDLNENDFQEGHASLYFLEKGDYDAFLGKNS